MIKLYKVENNLSREVKTIASTDWVNVYEPTKEELDFLRLKLKLDKELIDYCLDENEISRVITKDNKKVVLIDVPVIDKKRDSLFYTVSLAIIIEENKVYTICSKEYLGLEDFYTNKISSGTSTAEFLLNLMDRITISYLNNLKTMNNQANKIERTLKKSTKNKEMFKLMNISKSLVYLRTSLIANARVFELISNDKELINTDEKEEHISNIIIENRQANETASIYSEILNGMMDAFASIVNNNLNLIMKFLAGATIVFSIPTMIASFMGMNLDLGQFATNPYAALYVIILSLVLAMIVAYILKKKNML